MYPGAVSTPGNLDPSDPPKITGTTPKVHTERNFSVPATCILTQITTTALSLFKEHLKESHYLHKQYHLERNAEKSLSCSMGSQRVAPGLKDPLLSSETLGPYGEGESFEGLHFTKSACSNKLNQSYAAGKCSAEGQTLVSSSPLGVILDQL